MRNKLTVHLHFLFQILCGGAHFCNKSSKLNVKIHSLSMSSTMLSDLMPLSAGWDHLSILWHDRMVKVLLQTNYYSTVLKSNVLLIHPSTSILWCHLTFSFLLIIAMADRKLSHLNVSFEMMNDAVVLIGSTVSIWCKLWPKHI